MKRYNLNKTAPEPLHKRYKGLLNIDHEKRQDDKLPLKPFMRENVLGLTNIDDPLKAIGDSMLQIKGITNHFKDINHLVNPINPSLFQTRMLGNVLDSPAFHFQQMAADVVSFTQEEQRALGLSQPLDSTRQHFSIMESMPKLSFAQDTLRATEQIRNRINMPDIIKYIYAPQMNYVANLNTSPISAISSALSFAREQVFNETFHNQINHIISPLNFDTPSIASIYDDLPLLKGLNLVGFDKEYQKLDIQQQNKLKVFRYLSDLLRDEQWYLDYRTAEYLIEYLMEKHDKEGVEFLLEQEMNDQQRKDMNKDLEQQIELYIQECYIELFDNLLSKRQFAFHEDYLNEIKRMYENGFIMALPQMIIAVLDNIFSRWIRNNETELYAYRATTVYQGGLGRDVKGGISHITKMIDQETTKEHFSKELAFWECMNATTINNMIHGYTELFSTNNPYDTEQSHDMISNPALNRNAIAHGSFDYSKLDEKSFFKTFILLQTLIPCADLKADKFFEITEDLTSSKRGKRKKRKGSPKVYNIKARGGD